MVKGTNLYRLLLLQMHINTPVYLKIKGQIKEGNSHFSKEARIYTGEQMHTGNLLEMSLRIGASVGREHVPFEVEAETVP